MPSGRKKKINFICGCCFIEKERQFFERVSDSGRAWISKYCIPCEEDIKAEKNKLETNANATIRMLENNVKKDLEDSKYYGNDGSLGGFICNEDV